VKFSDGEKLIAIMLADIIQANDLDSEVDPDFVKDAITSDHLWALRWEYSGIFHEAEDDPEMVRETADILTMCRVLENSIDELEPADLAKIPERERKVFVGFDGNHDDHFGVASMFIAKMGMWEEFKGRGLNSHRTILPRYRRMLAAYEAAGGAGRFPLPLAEIQAILRLEETSPATAA
jgi:uncharacterized protein YfbU (UPF0304 family)